MLRFKFNWAVVATHERATSCECPVGPEADMNALAIQFQTQEPRPSLRQYAEFHMLIGYSVSGFCELSFFKGLEVRTPQWKRDGARPWAPPRRKPKKAPLAQKAPDK